MNTDRVSIFASAVNTLAAIMSQGPLPPSLYGPDGKILPASAYQYHRKAAERSGSLKNWIPRRLFSDQQAAIEREEIVARSIDLSQNDAHAAGILDTFGSCIVGSGLSPHFRLDGKALGLTEEEDTALEEAARRVVAAWAPFADASGRMDFYGLQYLSDRMMLQYGEYLFLLFMLDDPTRRYSLSLMPVNPLRLKTPIDLISKAAIRDGIEIGAFGEPTAYWIKKSDPFPFSALLPDVSKNFVRVPVRTGHRIHVLHGYVCNDPDQVRGIPVFAPAIKLFRDISDYLDAELVSNIVTAAFALFIETGSANPFDMAQRMATGYETAKKSDGTEYTIRHQEMRPGQILYGGPGEKPHPIAAQRPGATFEPFIRAIQHSIALSVGIPYPVLFKNFQGMNYASYRSAMLEAWRVFQSRRVRLGRHFCQPVIRMLLEEAYLRGGYPAINFYDDPIGYTNAEWIGPAKGQIEPVKEIQADILAIQNNLKSREETLLEHNRDVHTTFKQLADEQAEMEELGLFEGKIEPNPDLDKETDDDDAD